MTFTPSTAQARYFDWIANEQGNAVIEAVAGAGKTTTLIHGLDFMQGRVFLGAYNSKMAKELRERTAGRQGVFASTFHGAGFKQLRYTFKHDYAEGSITDKKCANLAAAVVVQRDDLTELALAIPAIVSMAKQRAFGVEGVGPAAEDNAAWEEMISHFGLDENLPDNARMDQVIAFARVVLQRSNLITDLIDFDDMVYLPLVKNLRMLKHEFVLIDEAQDTNPARRALAARMLNPETELAAGGRLVAVGDPHQAIYGFTGADNDSLDIIRREFNAVSLPLTVSYRCPKAVVAEAQKYVAHIEAHEDAPEGEVAYLEYDRLLKAVNPGDAVVCRFNKYLVSTCFAMIRAGISAKIEGRAVGQGLLQLATKWKSIKTLDGLESKLLNWQPTQIAKLLQAQKERQADELNDKIETLMVLIARARDLGHSRVDDLAGVIANLFADNIDSSKMVTLCSSHRSKGLEWDTVFLLGRDELMPSPFARQEWQMDQEINLIYVSITRAKKTLVHVTHVKEEKAK